MTKSVCYHLCFGSYPPDLQSTALSEAATIMESLQSEKQDFQTQTERIIQDLTKAHQEEVEKLKKEINRLTELAKEQGTITTANKHYE